MLRPPSERPTGPHCMFTAAPGAPQGNTIETHLRGGSCALQRKMPISNSALLTSGTHTVTAAHSQHLPYNGNQVLQQDNTGMGPFSRQRCITLHSEQGLSCPSTSKMVPTSPLSSQQAQVAGPEDSQDSFPSLLQESERQDPEPAALLQQMREVVNDIH